MEQSILKDIKKLLVGNPDDPVFDQDLLIHINSALSDLRQLGVGPEEGFVVGDDIPTWPELLGDNIAVYSNVKSWLGIKVRLLFDLPQYSFHIEAYERQLAELTWRISQERENRVRPGSEEPIPQ